MNAHNEQHDSASPVVKQNLTTQPAAAQEGVRQPDGYHYRYPNLYGTDTCIRKNNGEEVNGSKPVEAVPYWYAPVTAAPAVVPIADSYVQPVPDKCDRIVWRGHYYHLPVNSKSTPAAPGIDMGVPGATLTIDGKTFTVDEVRAALLIDASPKGATFPNDGNSEAQFIADGERLNCPACGGSGNVEDSPKDGSEAQDAARYRFLREVAHPDSDDGIAVTIQKQDSWGNWRDMHLHGPELDAATDAAMQAQAGDAEVQP